MKIKNTIKLNTCNILTDKVEQGINFGWKHAHKYDNNPSEEIIKQHIYEDVINSLSEILDFES